VTAIIVVFVAIIVLVTIANRINVAYPIVLVLGGIAIGYIPGVPTIPFPPELVLVVFLPPLLYWESVTAPTSEFRAGALWIFQMAFGLVIVTTIVVAAVAHAIVPGMSWGVAFVLGAIVSSTDEVAFAAIADQLNVPRHIIGTIEGESLVNDATSLILYAIGIAAVVGASFSLLHAVGALLLTIVVSVVMGLIVAVAAALAWRLVKDETLQATISVVVPFLSYLPAYYLGMSGVLATVTTGIAVTRFAPIVLQPRAREMLTGFWVTVVFLLNAFIFTEVGIRFHEIVARLHEYSVWQLLAWSVAVALTCIIIRLLWTFAQGLLPATNEPEHVSGKADWSHVALLAWTGMRGGVSLAAALAIPFETAAGPFPYRDLIIFLTFVVLLATLVGQGGTLSLIIRWLKIRDDGVAAKEERLALMAASRAGLQRLDELAREGKYSAAVCDLHRRRLEARYEEFTSPKDMRAARRTAEYRELQTLIVQAQRKKLLELRAKGKVDNTVFRRLQRVLDLRDLEVELSATAGHSDLEED
jgi:CPA1 family monovalent cation:H+ antiporter